jgi:hypothetical protein
LTLGYSRAAESARRASTNGLGRRPPNSLSRSPGDTSFRIRAGGDVEQALILPAGPRRPAGPKAHNHPGQSRLEKRSDPLISKLRAEYLIRGIWVKRSPDYHRYFPHSTFRQVSREAFEKSSFLENVDEMSFQPRRLRQARFTRLKKHRRRAFGAKTAEGDHQNCVRAVTLITGIERND